MTIRDRAVAIWRRAWPALLLFAIAVGFYWKIVLSKQYIWLDSPDLVFQVLPWIQFQTATWQSGSFPLWDPNLWAGHPVVGQVQPAALNPLNWVLFSLPMKDGFIRLGTLNWYLVLIHYLAALLMYLFCRDRGLSRLSSILGGCAFSFGGFMATNMWPQMLMSALWLPVVLLFLLRVDDGRRPVASAALAGVFLGLAFLGGHHNVPIYATVCAGAFWIHHLLTGDGFRRARWMAVVLFAACFAAVAAVQILPAVELGQWSLRWAGAANPLPWDEPVPYTVHDNFSLYPTSILGFIVPSYSRHTDTFMGLVVLTYAALGVALAWRRRTTRIAAVLAMLGLLLALGSDSLLHGLVYQFWPGFHTARNISMAVALCHLGLAVLAACGLEACFEHAREARRSQTLAVRSLVVLAVLLYAALIVLITVRNEQSREYRVFATTALNALLVAAVLAAWLRRKIPNWVGGALLIALALGEMHPVATYGFRHRDMPSVVLNKLQQHSDIAAFFRSRSEPVRVEIDRDEIPYNFGDWYGINQSNGYLAGLFRHIVRLQDQHRRHVLLGTNYYVRRTPASPWQELVFTSSSGLNVYRDSGTLARVRTVHEVIGVANDDQAVAATLRPELDLARTAVVEGIAPKLDTCAAADQVRLTGYTANRATVDAQMSCRGLLILGDAWFPGWKAYVDGKPTPVLRTCSLVRGVVVDAGAHRVTFRYEPWTVWAGALLALAGLSLCGVVVCTPLGKKLERWAAPKAEA